MIHQNHSQIQLTNKGEAYYSFHDIVYKDSDFIITDLISLMKKDNNTEIIGVLDKEFHDIEELLGQKMF